MIQDETGVAEPQAPAERASRWEDYIDIFFSPAELYRRRAADRVGPPLITLLLLGTFFYFILLPANRLLMLATLPDDPQAAEAVARMGTVLQVVGGVFVPLTYVVVLVVVAALLWMVGRFAEIPTTFSRTMLIATYAGFVYLRAQVAGGVSVLLHGEVGLDVVRHTSFGPLRFVGHADMNPVALGLLRRFDIFNIWQAVLWAIGLAVIYRTTRAQAAITAAAAWLLFAIPGIVGAALSAMSSMRG
jgi:hypothetical protein